MILFIARMAGRLKVCQSLDRNITERMEDQQVFIAADDAISVCGYGQFQKLVVAWIAARVNLGRDGNRLAGFDEGGHECLCIIIINIRGKFGPREHCGEFRRSGATVKQPMGAGEFVQLECEGRVGPQQIAHPQIGIDDDPHSQIFRQLIKERLRHTAGLGGVAHTARDVGHLLIKDPRDGLVWEDFLLSEDSADLCGVNIFYGSGHRSI